MPTDTLASDRDAHSLPIVPVIMCGGSGTRLWPLSRESYPKQFLRLLGNASLLQNTVRRCAGISHLPPLLLTQEASRYIVADQLRELGMHDFTQILEPEKRGTAPAIVCAAIHLCREMGDAIMLVLPSDHQLQDTDEFIDAAHTACEAAGEGWLMTFGIRPDAPETGYGYLRAGKSLGGKLIQLSGFIEKPDRETAERYLASQQYFWNSGMFAFRCGQLLNEITCFQPLIRESCEQALSKASLETVAEGKLLRLDSTAYARNPDISIDHALMEHTIAAAMVPIEAGWSDIGCWSAVWKTSVQDKQGNTITGAAMLDDCTDCLVHSENGNNGNNSKKRVIAAIGLKDVVIVDTDDALLVMDRSRAQDNRHMVARLLADQRPEALAHRQVARPWGQYEAIDQGQNYQVKHITVKPGEKLSVQLHHHRAEHWIVVSGTARVTEGERSYLLTENQSTYISIGQIHSPENPGKIPLELIEVQCGSYLGEDDIVRLHDNYGRA